MRASWVLKRTFTSLLGGGEQGVEPVSAGAGKELAAVVAVGDGVGVIVGDAVSLGVGKGVAVDVREAVAVTVGEGVGSLVGTGVMGAVGVTVGGNGVTGGRGPSGIGGGEGPTLFEMVTSKSPSSSDLVCI